MRGGDGEQDRPEKFRPGLNVEETLGNETADEGESSFQIFQPGSGSCLYPHAEDSQDLNLDHSQYDHCSGFSEEPASLVIRVFIIAR